MIKAIIFDCFGVLYRDNISMLYDEVPNNQRQALQDIIHATDYGFLSRGEYYARIAEIAGKTPEEIRAVDDRQHTRDERMIAYSQEFRPAYKVALLSNIDSETIRRLFPNFEQLFDAFVVSGDVGMTKPSVELFEFTAAKLGLPPEGCLMIDDLPKNVEGAKLAGMKAVLFTSQRQLEEDLLVVLGQENA